MATIKKMKELTRLFREREISSTKRMFSSTSTGEGPSSRTSTSSEDDQSVETAMEASPTNEEYSTAVQEPSSRTSTSSEDDQSVETAMEASPTNEEYSTAVQE
ncbi:hypothetical protein HPB50_016493 [Hyalomma asiaticum]|uniref:Uncharacterized protein n=1 Tax=Hyalomma asiaticum TaxID=266040 RepID=A0ACB7SX19_HYAAI|nr:hypothetical protein HPB50_016493 [Hyalomma asiaticum]